MTAPQIAEFLNFDASIFPQAKLRRLSSAAENNPITKLPWIPKPLRSKFPFHATLRGLFAYLLHHAQAKDSPPDFASMQLCESAGHIPRACQQWLKKRGVNFLKLGHRVDREALMLGLEKELLLPLFSGDTSRIASLDLGADHIDGEYEKNRRARADAESAERDNALAARRIHDLDEVEQRLRLELLTPLRDGLQSLLKKFHRLKKTNPAVAAEILEHDLPGLLTRLATQSGSTPTA